jgi:RecA-family ATPase
MNDPGFDIFTDEPRTEPAISNGADNWRWPDGPEEYGLSADVSREGEADADRETTEPDIIEPLETIDPADWDGQKPPERRWIIRNMIPLGEAGLLNGHGGAGKTLLGCQLAVAVNMAADCVGFAVEHGGPVLLYSAEERQEELHRRLDVILASRSKRLGDLKGFRIYCPPPTETMLTTAGRDGLVRPTMTMLRLEKTIETLRPVLVTIDHVSIAFGGSEIDRSIVGQNVGFMKRLAGICGSAVLGFQHVSFAGLNSDEGSSGSTQWHNAARARMWLRGVKDDETSDLRELIIKKQNYGKDGQKHLLRWQQPGLFVPVGTPSLVERASEEAKVESAYLDCLRAIEVQGRRVGPYTGRSYAPAVFEGSRRRRLAPTRGTTQQINLVTADLAPRPQARSTRRCRPNFGPSKEFFIRMIANGGFARAFGNHQ